MNVSVKPTTSKGVKGRVVDAIRASDHAGKCLPFIFVLFAKLPTLPFLNLPSKQAAYLNLANSKGDDILVKIRTILVD